MSALLVKQFSLNPDCHGIYQLALLVR